MKKLITILKKNYHLHFLGMYILGVKLIDTYDGVPMGFRIFLTVFITGGLGILWEWGWAAYNKSEVDYDDVAAGIIGGAISLFFPEYLAAAIISFLAFLLLMFKLKTYNPK
jgi:hypothetical protein